MQRLIRGYYTDNIQSSARTHSELPVGIYYGNLVYVRVLEAVDAFLGKYEHYQLAFVLNIAEICGLDNFWKQNLDEDLLEEVDRPSVDVLKKDEHGTEVTLVVHGPEVDGAARLQEQVELGAIGIKRTHVCDEGGLGNHGSCVGGKELCRDLVCVGVHI
jgi:hypothetical protein